MTAHCLIGLSTQFHACMGSRPFLQQDCLHALGGLWGAPRPPPVADAGRAQCVQRSAMAKHLRRPCRAPQTETGGPTCSEYRKAPLFRVEFLMSALLIFAVRATIVLPSATVRWTVAGRKTPLFRVEFLMSALPIFAVRATIVLPSATVRWTVAGRKTPLFRVELLCLRYLFSR